MTLFASLADEGVSATFAFVLRASPLLTLARQANERNDQSGTTIGLFTDDADALAWLESVATT